MIDMALIAIGSIAGLALLMFLAMAWCDFAVWAIDAVCDAWRKVRP